MSQLKGKGAKSKKKISKVFLQSQIATSSCSGPELFYFLNFDYHGCETECLVPEASISKIIEESFKFIMPDGVPEYYKHFSSKDNSWKTVSELMYEEFSKNDIIKWQMSNHTLDYNNASVEDLNRHKDELRDALDIEDADECYSKKHLVGSVILELHSLLALLKSDTENDLVQDKTTRHDRVKGIMYSIFNLWDFNCRINGHARFKFILPQCARLTNDVTTFTSKPDGTLYALDSGKVPVELSAIGVDYNFYPYLVMEVYGPFSEDVMSVLSESSTPQATCGDSDSDDSVAQVTSRMRKLTVPYKGTPAQIRNRIQNKMDFYEDEVKHHRKTIRKVISDESPFPKTNEMRLALRKSTGQLPMEMYGALVLKMMMKNVLCDLNKDESSQAVGIFVINEKIYLEKIVIPNHVGKFLIQEGRRLEAIREAQGTAIHLAQWCFDLKIPNHRIAFQAFVYYLEKLTFAELRNMRKRYCLQ